MGLLLRFMVVRCEGYCSIDVDITREYNLFLFYNLFSKVQFCRV